MIKKSHITFVVILVGVSITVYCYYPGFMSPDSFVQLKQARAGLYHDWHPPIMSYVWGILDRIIPGPAGMLILHNLLFWFGIGIFVSGLLGHRLLSWLLILMIGFLPPIFALLGTIWKEVGFGSALLFAVAMYLKAQRAAQIDQAKANLTCTLAILATFYGLAVRYNASPAVIPLLVWSGWILTAANLQKFPTTVKEIAPLIIGALLVLLLMISTIKINNRLINGRQRFPSQQIFVHDLVAISLENNRVLLPDYLEKLNPPITLSDLRRIYSPESIGYMFFGDPATTRVVPLIAEKAKFNELLRCWLEVIRKHPRSYLIHRWRVFKSLIAIGRTYVGYPFHWGIQSNKVELSWVKNLKFIDEFYEVQPEELGLSFHQRWLNDWVFRGLYRVKDTIFFRAWFFLGIILFTLVGLLLTKRRKFISVHAVGLSGLCYELAYFFVGTASDFRMSWWTVCAAVLVVLLALFESPTGNPTEEVP